MKRIIRRDCNPQICNVAYSPSSNHLVSVHGYSAPQSEENQIRIWDGKQLRLEVAFGGHHKARILGLAFDPEGKNFVTGSPDETLRFWNLENLLENEQKAE